MFGWKNKSDKYHHRATEMSGAYDGGLTAATHGLMAGTRVASNLGWRAVEALAPGDLVLTFDNGMQPIAEVRRSSIWLDAPDTQSNFWPVIVPAGALGNRTELTLLAEQGVLVESDAAQDMYGDPFAIVAATALDGVRGIHRAPPMQQIELITVTFAEEQVVYAEGGALIHCPATSVTLDRFLDTNIPCYEILDRSNAAFVVECMVIEDQILATAGQRDTQSSAHC